MPSAEELVNAWREQGLPTRVERRDFEKVLNWYFPGCWRHARGGSHMVLEHPCLERHPHYPAGRAAFASEKGRRVKPIYVGRLLEAVRLLERWDDRAEPGNDGGGRDE